MDLALFGHPDAQSTSLEAIHVALKPRLDSEFTLSELSD